MNKENYLFTLKQNISKLPILFTVKTHFFLYQQTLTMHESAKDYFHSFLFPFSKFYYIL